MDEARAVDLNFTYAIVGPPLSVSLGRRLGPLAVSAHGVKVGLRESTWELGTGWMEWWMLHAGEGWAGSGVRRRPGPVRRWLERRALVIAMLGLLMFGASGVLFLLRLP